MLCNIETLRNPILPEELAALRPTLPDLQGRALLSVRAHTDQVHFIKMGNWDYINWEFYIYSYVQRACQFPVICERHIDFGAGAGSHALVLHKVVCFNIEKSRDCPSVLFTNGPFPYNIVAWCAKRLILAMQKLHQHGVLHCDIHPGNVGVTRSWSVWETILEGKTVVEPIRPVFIDYQWARMNGFHPKVAEGASILCWAYASDRALRLEAPYSTAYDVEALSYVLLALRMGCHPPWLAEVKARSLDVEDFSNYSQILQIRDRVLATMSAEATVEPELLAFIHHARHLSPTDAIDYAWWANVFDVTVSPEELEQFFYGR